MALIRRPRTELDPFDWFPAWFPGRRLFESWPDTWRDFFEESSLRVEEFEEDNKLVVRAEMPGIDPDKDVEITVSDNTLHIKAERRQESKTEDKRGYRSEFRYGSFVRTVPLPAGANEKDISATYQDGILEVRVPVDAGKAETKKIPVSRG
ncbi:MAG TPA: Hsp20/alpha crystallin family protein [Acidimicrobiales bacterium]